MSTFGYGASQQLSEWFPTRTGKVAYRAIEAVDSGLIERLAVYVKQLLEGLEGLLDIGLETCDTGGKVRIWLQFPGGGGGSKISNCDLNSGD
jgi:hypothetical protein